jgi:ABC-type transport system substrate-binding protein
LKRSEIDVLDHVFPGDVPGLRSDPALKVEAYRAPTTHVLAVRSKDPFLQSAAFRRALLYASNRDLLLTQGILRGADLPGFRVISSAFPAPLPNFELPAYAYDERIDPRAYDPPLGKALVLVAENEIRSAFQKQEKQAPKRGPLVLGHPADEVSRIACRGLAKDWKRIGVETRLLELPAGIFDDAKGECDLVYLQLAAWEPLIDAGRLFGPAGLAPSASPAIQLLLRQIETAPNWPEARRLLTTLHRLVHEDVTVLPLWQTFDHYAFRRGSLPSNVRRLTLYQDIEAWRPATSPARPTP